MILCGGKGQRLWPLSRTSTPKQLVSLDNQKTLLESTVERLTPLKRDIDKIGIVTNKEYFQAIQQLLGDIVDTYTIEPCGKNTAPAILYSCFQIADENETDPVVVFTPADHYIKEQPLFEQTLKKVISYAESYGDICLIGVKPSRPSSVYGYILANNKDEINTPINIDKFIEKPPQEIAELLWNTSYTLWNSGIFVARNSIFLQAFKEAAPELYENLRAVVNGHKEYAEISPCSFDVTITEQIANRVVFASNITWQDLGDLESFVSHAQQRETAEHKNYISLHGEGNIAHGKKKLIAFVGVSNLCVIETDEIILVKKTGDSENIRELVQKLEEEGFANLV
jgi:mannose-1-phosphate guanylyltransferase